MRDQQDVIVFYGGRILQDQPTSLVETNQGTPEFDPNPGDELMWGDITVQYAGYRWEDPFFKDPTTGKYYLLSNSDEYTDGRTLVVWEKQYTDDPLPPACFVKGTVIDTSGGAKPIEDLQPGDQVKCLSGWREVKWIGWRAFGAAAFRTQKYRAAHCPVTIKAHAVDENVPAHDIRVSPWHHLFVDGLLVRAMDLINGNSIIQDLGVREVSYYHVELDQFDVIMAHGIYSESWADGGNRDFFQNADVTALDPTTLIRRRAKRPGFTVIRPGDSRLLSLNNKIFLRTSWHSSFRCRKTA